MKSLKYILEKNLNSLRIGINDSPYSVRPNTWEEVRQIIEYRYEKEGPGSKNNPIDFNDIDIANITTIKDDSTTQYMGSYGGISMHKIGPNSLFSDTEFEYIDISGWDVSNIENMACMFSKCYKLKSVGDISNWDVSNVKDMEQMFSGCESLQRLDLSKWNINKVKSTEWMFNWCRCLKSVGDLSNWKMGNTKIDGMFHQCKQLTDVGDLNNWKVRHNMFINNTFLGSKIKVENRPDWSKDGNRPLRFTK